jgi:hypothetical protein
MGVSDTQAFQFVNFLKHHQWGPTLNVGVRRPFSNVNGSATSVTALANSKPLSWYNRHRVINKESQQDSFVWIEY